MITHESYPAAGKIILSNVQTGIMISTEYYTELSGKMSDEDMFEFLKVE